MDPYHYPDDGPIAFRQERDLGDVIRVTLQWMREMAGVWIPAIAAIAGPLYLISAIASALVGGNSSAIGLIGLVEGLAGLLMSGAIFGIVRRYRVGEVEASIGDVWEEAKAWVGPLFGFGLVSLLFAVLILIPFSVVIVLAGGEDAPVGLWIAAALTGLAVAILAAPYYNIGLASRVFDEDGAVDAYRRAASLIRPHRAFATGTVVVVFGMVYFIAIVLAGGLQEILVAFGASPVVVALGTILSLLAVVPAAVFGSVASVFLFETLVEREEGTLLDAEIAAIRDGATDESRQPVGLPLREVGVGPEAPDTRSFAERLRDRPPADDGSTDDAQEDASSSRPSGFRGGGFEDTA